MTLRSDSEWTVPLSRPDLDAATIARVVEVVKSPFLSNGPHLQAFEEAFARRLDRPFAVAMSSGTAGLHLAVRVLNLGAGSEVVTTPFSFIASANCLLYEDVQPVFVDIHPDTFVMDMDLVEAAITPRTSGLLPVHIFGHPVAMTRVQKLAERHGLAVIEDACEALGGKHRGRVLGSWGDIGVFGFYPNKQITTGEGGMAVTAKGDLAVRMRSLRNQGRSPDGDGSFCELGYNYRMSELAAVLGEMQIQQLDALLELRRRVETRYRHLLTGLDGLRVPPAADEPDEHSPFVFVVQAEETALRDALREHLHADGIQTGLYFRPIHLEPFYRRKFGFKPGAFPNAEHASRTCLALPFHNRLTAEDQELVVRSVKNGLTRWLKKKQISV